MKETIASRLSNLLSVKSIVTIMLTIVFAVQTCRGQVDQNLIMIYTVVMSFYFGTQSQKIQTLLSGETTTTTQPNDMEEDE